MDYRVAVCKARCLVHQVACTSCHAHRGIDAAALGHGRTGFLQYYSVGSPGRKAARTNRKPQREDELKGRQEGPHSILGIIAQSMERFGRSKHYILWKISYAELLAMNMDVSRYVSKEELIEREKNRRPETFTTEYFQTKLGG